jgi:galactokinase
VFSKKVATFSFDSLTKESSKFINYFKGCVKVLLDSNYPITQGFDIYLKSTLPSGAGLSSSASLEMLIISILFKINNIKISDYKTLPTLGKLVENTYINVSSGIMDQFIIANGIVNKCLLLSTSTLNFQSVDISLKDSSFYLINSNVAHKLETSKYNERVLECQSALSKLNKIHKFNNLCEIPLDFLKSNKGVLDNNEYLRTLHSITEQERVSQIMNCFLNSDSFGAGKLLSEGHYSLKDNYEVTCPETDFIVDLSIKYGSFGARQMGGGFGGCIIVLIDSKRSSQILSKIKSNFDEKYERHCSIYPIKIVDGTKFIFS